MACPSCGSAGFDGTCPYCSGDLVGAVEAGQVDQRDFEGEPEYPEPTSEELCEAYGHPPNELGADRCYCGEVRYNLTIGTQLDEGLI